MTEHTNTTAPDGAESQPARVGTPGTAAALWASAFVLAGMLVLRAMDVGPAPAYAMAFDMANTDGSYTMMTTSAGNEELLFVVDNHSESFFVYGVENRDRFELLERRSLPELFTVMKARSR